MKFLKGNMARAKVH